MAAGALAGLCYFDGRAADRETLNGMLGFEAGNSGAPSDLWTGGPAGFGVKPSTKYGASNRASLAAREGFAAAGKANLYARDDFPDAESDARVGSDILYILSAYRRWGEECVEHFSGDFAFAIWDARKQAMFCARDHFGVRPFYYRSTRTCFAFASAIEPLLRLSKGREVRDEAVADHLLGQVTDAVSTLYRDVQRLPAGHCVTIGPNGPSIRRYWTLAAQALQPQTDHPERFRELFRKAVTTRLAGADDAGAMLSGGLDSSSIACVARDDHRARGEALPTFSLVYDNTPSLNERSFIEKVLEQGGFRPSFVPAQDFAPFARFDELLEQQEGVFLAPNLASIINIHRAAVANGSTVLLDGHGGDEVVSHAYGRLDDLAREHQWRRLWRELAAANDTYRGSRLELFMDILFRNSARGKGMRAARKAERLLRAARRPGIPVKAGVDRRRFIKPELITRTDLMARLRASRNVASDATEPEQHLAMLTGPAQPYAFEVLDKVAGATGVDVRFPFWDKDLVEFCVSVPSDQKLDGGWSRLILRRAMDGILPRDIQWRRDKLDFTPHLKAGMVKHHRDLIESVVAGDALAAYVNRPVLIECWHRMVEGRHVDGAEVQALWRAITLGIWLRDRSKAVSSALRAA